MIASVDTDILLALGNAARDTGAWNPVLALLRDQMQASHATLFTEGEAHGAPLPRPDCFDALRPNRVYTTDELTDRAGPFDPDFSTGDHRAVGLQDPPVWLWLSRTRGEFRAADSARLSSLIPHFGQAVVQAQERAELAAALAQAQALLWRAGLGRIGPEGPDKTAARLLAEAGAPAPGIRPGTLASLPGGMSAYGVADGCTLLRATRALPAPEQIAPALGLTLSEARLARALALGHGLPKASAELGLSRETGRSYAKQIYAKTGVTGQSRLVRLIWCSALAFGAGGDGGSTPRPRGPDTARGPGFAEPRTALSRPLP